MHSGSLECMAYLLSYHMSACPTVQVSPAHITLASSLCLQLCSLQPLWLQSSMEFSVPLQCTLSIQIRRFSSPAPKNADFGAPKAVLNPSCLQTTFASFKSQKSSQMVPHSPLYEISTRPSVLFAPPTSRMVTLGRKSAKQDKRKRVGWQ